jgi:hypothetical protein
MRSEVAVDRIESFAGVELPYLFSADPNVDPTRDFADVRH